MIYFDEVSDRVKSVQESLCKLNYPVFPIDIKILKIKNKGVAGYALPRFNLIEISEYYLAENFDETIKTTVAHEVVHLYVRKYHRFAKQNHGPEFRSIMRLLGLEGRTYHKMELKSINIPKRTKTRFIYITEKTKTEIKVTASQHKKIDLDITGKRYTWKGEYLQFTGKILQFT